jgi:hypothetical protein
MATSHPPAGEALCTNVLVMSCIAEHLYDGECRSPLDLSRLALVSKRWRDVALPLLYRQWDCPHDPLDVPGDAYLLLVR